MLLPIRMLIILVSVISGCAYRLGVSQKQLPGGFKNVSVPVFKNKTSEPQIEVYFTNSLLSEIERAHVAKVVDAFGSEAVIEGTIENLQILPGGRREGGDLPSGALLASEYRILMSVKVRVVKKSDGSVVWENTVFGERPYKAPQVTQSVVNTVNPLYNQSARRLNIEVMAKQMMSEAFALMTESF